MSWLHGWSAQEEFAPDLLSAHQARAFVSHQLRLHHLDYLAADAELVVSELVTNAVLHARTHLVVSISQSPQRVRLAVHDNSPSFPVPRDAEPTDAGGRGMSLVEAYSTEWGTTRNAQGHKSVWATFAPRGESSGAT